MSASQDLRPAYCRPHGTDSFALDALYRDTSGNPAGRLAVPQDELLHWAELAAAYSRDFRQALQAMLASIDQKSGADHA